jgi:hypothetical protein
VSGQLPVRRVNYLRAMWLLATGRREAFALLGGDTRAFMNSLAPLVAFILVASSLEMLSGQIHRGLTMLLVTLCNWLTPAVIAEPLCRRWGRMDRWALFANVMNWLTILMVPVLIAGAFIGVALVSAGLPLAAAVLLLMLGGLCYLTWLQWFAARGALGITRWQAFKLLCAIELGMVLLVVLQLATGSGPILPPGLEEQLK